MAEILRDENTEDLKGGPMREILLEGGALNGTGLQDIRIFYPSYLNV